MINITQHRVASGIVAVVAVWVCFISFTQQPAEAYLFPRIISVVFVTLSFVTFVKSLLGRSRVGKGLSVEMAKNMLPGLIISGFYILWAAKNLGFYTATAITFFMLLSFYDPKPNNKAMTWIRRVFITFGFIAIMYALFALVLKVFTPQGMFI